MQRSQHDRQIKMKGNLCNKCNRQVLFGVKIYAWSNFSAWWQCSCMTQSLTFLAWSACCDILWPVNTLHHLWVTGTFVEWSEINAEMCDILRSLLAIRIQSNKSFEPIFMNWFRDYFYGRSINSNTVVLKFYCSQLRDFLLALERPQHCSKIARSL